MAVQSAPVQLELHPLHLYRTHEASGVSPETAVNQARPLPRRYATHGPVQGMSPTPLGINTEVFRVVGVHGEHQKEHIIPKRGLKSWSFHRFHQDKILPSKDHGTFNYMDGQEHGGK